MDNGNHNITLISHSWECCRRPVSLREADSTSVSVLKHKRYANVELPWAPFGTLALRHLPFSTPLPVCSMIQNIPNYHSGPIAESGIIIIFIGSAYSFLSANDRSERTECSFTNSFSKQRSRVGHKYSGKSVAAPRIPTSTGGRPFEGLLRNP